MTSCRYFWPEYASLVQVLSLRGSCRCIRHGFRWHTVTSARCGTTTERHTGAGGGIHSTSSQAAATTTATTTTTLVCPREKSKENNRQAGGAAGFAFGANAYRHIRKCPTKRCWVWVDEGEGGSPPETPEMVEHPSGSNPGWQPTLWIAHSFQGMVSLTSLFGW